MFKRIIYDNWTEIIPIISFWITFSIFIAIVIRSIFMKPTEAKRMGHMPLQDANKTQPDTSES